MRFNHHHQQPLKQQMAGKQALGNGTDNVGVPRLRPALGELGNRVKNPNTAAADPKKAT